MSSGIGRQIGSQSQEQRGDAGDAALEPLGGACTLTRLRSIEVLLSREWQPGDQRIQAERGACGVVHGGGR